MNRPALEQLTDATRGDLASISIAWGRRGPTPAVGGPTPRDVEILSLLHDVSYLTTSMVQMLFWGGIGQRGPTTACARRLKLLHDVGVIDRFRPRVPRDRGSHEWIHRLSTRGWEVLLAVGRTADGVAYRPAVITNIAYVEHDVQINALVLSLAARMAEGSGPLFPLPQTVGFEWHGPRRGTVDTRDPEFPVADRHPGSFFGGRGFEFGRSLPGVIRPDATLIGRDRENGEQNAVLIEYDRTRRASKQLERFRRYDRFLSHGWRKSRYAISPNEPAFLFVCDAEPQLANVVKAADPELTAYLFETGQANQRGPRYYPGREQTAFTTLPRLLAGDWRMSQLASGTGDERHRRHLRAPSEITFPLDRLFRRVAPAA